MELSHDTHVRILASLSAQCGFYGFCMINGLCFKFLDTILPTSYYYCLMYPNCFDKVLFMFHHVNTPWW